MRLRRKHQGMGYLCKQLETHYWELSRIGRKNCTGRSNKPFSCLSAIVLLLRHCQRNRMNKCIYLGCQTHFTIIYSLRTMLLYKPQMESHPIHNKQSAHRIHRMYWEGTRWNNSYYSCLTFFLRNPKEMKQEKADE